MNFWNYVVDVMPLESFCYTQGQKLRLRFADIPDLNQTSFFQQPKASPHKVSNHVSAEQICMVGLTYFLFLLVPYLWTLSF